jgi:hypothetical protein
LSPKLSIPNLQSVGRLYKNKTTASLVIYILLCFFMDLDLSTRKMNWYFCSRSDAKSRSSRGLVEAIDYSGFSEEEKVGRKEAITATSSGYLEDF